MNQGMEFVLSGSVGGARLFSRQYRDIRGELHFYRLEPDGLVLRKKVTYKDPPRLVAKGRVRCTGGCVVGDQLYVTTFSQVLKVDLRTFSVRPVVTSREYNDLHGVSFNGSQYAVVNTGLDRIHLLDGGFREIGTVDVGRLSGSTRRFANDIDYRNVKSTKPHYVHPNHCFWYEGRWWITRFMQEDAFCPETGERWDFSRYGRPHDGIVRDDGVYFTTITGYLLKVSHDRRITAWDLPRLTGRERIGWGRGLMVTGKKAFVGFTKIRRSISSMAKGFVLARGDVPDLSARILELDIGQNKICREYVFPDHYFRHLTIFGLIPYRLG